MTRCRAQLAAAVLLTLTTVGAGQTVAPPAAVDIVYTWASSFSHIEAVEVGWAWQAPGSGDLRFEEARLGPEGSYRIATWRFSGERGTPREQVASRAFELASSPAWYDRAEVVSRPAGEALVNTGMNRQHVAVASNARQPSAQSFRRSDYLLARWLMKHAGAIAQENVSMLPAGSIEVRMPDLRAVAVLGRAGEGWAVHRLDVNRADGTPEYSFRNSDFRKYESMPHPVAASQELWSRSFTGGTVVLGGVPDGPLALNHVSYLVFAGPIRSVTPATFRVSPSDPEQVGNSPPTAPPPPLGVQTRGNGSPVAMPWLLWGGIGLLAVAAGWAVRKRLSA